MKHHQIHHENTLLVSEASQACQASPCACLQAVLLRGTTITFQDHQDGIAVAGRPRHDVSWPAARGMLSPLEYHH